MSDMTKDFCPKCITGTLRKFSHNETICQKCGKIYGPTKAAPQPERVSGPRPGGNRYAG